MITPRRTRLVRVPDLRSFRHAVVRLALAGDASERRSRLVVVPTVGAARLLKRHLDVSTIPDVVTRDELYDRLRGRLERPLAALSPYDRDVMMQSAAREAREASSGDGRSLRPGLIAEALRFYDQLRRQGRSVGRFEELLIEALSKDAEHDRGAERMLAQARWLAATFRGYERRVSDARACDEHGLRDALVAGATADPVRGVLVTVADWIADPDGLFPADYDLLTRLPGLTAIDLVATATLLESGFHQRIHEWLPDIEEVSLADAGLTSPDVEAPPRLIGPLPDGGSLAFLYRDREEELGAVVAAVNGRPTAAQLSDVGVVVKRPLPYVYLAREVFGRHGLAYQAFDALPLAAEPFAAAVDLVLDFAESGFTRESIVALIGSPHFAFAHDGSRLERASIAALDAGLSETRYLGTLDRLMEVDTSEMTNGELAAAALAAARAAATRLAPLLAPAPASSQLQLIAAFIDDCAVRLDAADHEAARSRAAVLAVVSNLAAAHESCDDSPVAIGDVAASVRRWIEEHTFAHDCADEGIQLLDDQAARYAGFDELTFVGLVEGEWPERPKRNIFYPSWLLVSLGWPAETDRRAADTARFLELLASPRVRVAVSTISLDEEALVEPSIFVDEIARAALPVSRAPRPSDAGPLAPAGSSARAWLAMRSKRTTPQRPEFHGSVGQGAATMTRGDRAWSVSALETYLACPFQFFARYVLELAEDPEDEEVMDPRTQGQSVHEVFEAFFKRWQKEGHGTITTASVDTARRLFAEVVEDTIVIWKLSETEAAMERTRLLGSPAATGLGEAVFRMEADRAVQVVDRRLEHGFRGEFTLATSAGARPARLAGKADRIDLLADGTFRIIDYKLGWPPDKGRALQLPLYGLFAEQSLDALGRRWTLGEAAYIAFKGPRRVTSLFRSLDERDRVIAEAQQRAADTLDRIAEGQFPPTPDDVFRCETCSYSAVCRKEYVGDV